MSKNCVKTEKYITHNFFNHKGTCVQIICKLFEIFKFENSPYVKDYIILHES